MARKKRDIRSGKIIREVIEEYGMTYVMVNNKIMDLYKQGGQECINKETGEIKRVKFDSRNLVLYIGMQFLNKIEFWCYDDEIANFMGNWSVKRIKERLQELQQISLPMNNKVNKATKRSELLKEEILVPLVKKHKDRGFETKRTVKTYRYYTPFDCDLKEIKNSETGEKELHAHKYFIVTLYDLDLYINGILNEDEFALYLYLIQIFNSNDENKQGIAISVSKISENMRVKDSNVTQKRLNKLTELRVTDKFWENVKDEYSNGFPLIHTRQPKNYNIKLTTRNETSLYYYPIYNDTTIKKIRGIKPEPYPENEENKVDTDLLMDTDFNKQDADFLF
ncbi:hypothetical protein [Heyndrickxia ginsengihumi]|uniref:hypothetical protein n=1 Tax=Heyndrickxia ginsengihumi TaxID=363870 RepID=UPI00046F61D1|nr:hypothetical protein [Heyndrickxia ginsengihumi]